MKDFKKDGLPFLFSFLIFKAKNIIGISISAAKNTPAIPTDIPRIMKITTEEKKTTTSCIEVIPKK